jgi:hypothetical protein
MHELWNPFQLKYCFAGFYLLLPPQPKPITKHSVRFTSQNSRTRFDPIWRIFGACRVKCGFELQNSRDKGVKSG